MGKYQYTPRNLTSVISIKSLAFTCSSRVCRRKGWSPKTLFATFHHVSVLLTVFPPQTPTPAWRRARRSSQLPLVRLSHRRHSCEIISHVDTRAQSSTYHVRMIRHFRHLSCAANCRQQKCRNTNRQTGKRTNRNRALQARINMRPLLCYPGEAAHETRSSQERSAFHPMLLYRPPCFLFYFGACTCSSEASINSGDRAAAR